jgi:filamentous hemagglutinin family protein
MAMSNRLQHSPTSPLPHPPTAPHPFAPLLALCMLSTVALPTHAQLVPDATLGPESSIIAPGIEIRGAEADLIEGGAIRGENLFHSFTDFNVLEGQRVYFANPVGIDSILSRVTGGNASAIFGTLGVDGGADLFLINPNGVVFGVNAALDVAGSLYVTTAEAVELGNGVFSAVAPGQSQLLSVNPNTSFWNYLTENSGDVVNRGQLAIGGDLVLAGNTLDLQGQVAAAGDVSLLATDTVQIRDTAAVPFIGFAGGDLLVQGNQQVDIVALSHPDSRLFSYGDMVLRSANPVGGDAHYLSGGDFRVEGLDGSGGELFSPIDPIVRALGDVEIEAYIGTSLHILAGGSVTLGTGLITAPDVGTSNIDFLQETITLSNGSVIEVNGSFQPTLDIRAGVNPETIIGIPPLTILTGFDPEIDGLSGMILSVEASSADITVGDVWIDAPNGLVLLTNQYSPNAALTEGDIRITGEGLIRFGIDTSSTSGAGGEIVMDSRSDITTENSAIYTAGLDSSGDIVLIANDTVTFDGQDGRRLTGGFNDLVTEGTGVGGNIQITATNLEMLNGAQLSSQIFGDDGQGANIILNIEETVQLDGYNPITGLNSRVISSLEDGVIGKGGDIQINARNMEVTNGADIGTGNWGIGAAGNITLEIRETARFDGYNLITGSVSGAFSNIESSGEGQGGDIRLTAQNLEVSNGAYIGSGILGIGNAGDVILEIIETARFDGTADINGRLSGVLSRVALDGRGTGGDVMISARNLEVFNGASINTSLLGIGNGGNVILEIEDTAYLDDSGGVNSQIRVGGVGEGGNVQITARNLEVLNGSQISTGVFGTGYGGDAILTITDTVYFDGYSIESGVTSGVYSSIENAETNASRGQSQAGDVRISARNLEILNGATIRSSTDALGNAGNIVLDISETARFEGVAIALAAPSSALSGVGNDGEGQGGDIQITARNLEVLDGAVLASFTEGIGNAGNVILDIVENVRFEGRNSGLEGVSAAASQVRENAQGSAGNIQINAETLEVLDGATLTASTNGLGDAGNIILEIIETARFSNYGSASSEIQAGGQGQGGNIQLTTRNLEVLNGAILITATNGIGAAGNIVVRASETAYFSEGIAFSGISNTGEGRGGDIQITARNLQILDGAFLNATTNGLGDSGNIFLDIDRTARFQGSDPDGNVSRAYSSVFANGQGQGGNVFITADNLEILDDAQIGAGTFGQGDAGDIILEIHDTAHIGSSNPNIPNESGIFSNVEPGSEGQGGNIRIRSANLYMDNGAFVSASNQWLGNAGNILLITHDKLEVSDGDVTTQALLGSGGEIQIDAGTIFLFGDSDIRTNVNFGTNNGGNITITADALVALDDSDILAFSADGRGGNIDLSQTNFFGQDFRFAPPGTDPRTLDGNGRVDINASGGIAAGQISIGDTSFIENNLNELPNALVNPDALVANSCIARRNDPTGTLVLTGGDSLPQQTTDNPHSTYILGTVQPIPEAARENTIVEPQGVYRLADGRLVMSRECG